VLQCVGGPVVGRLESSGRHCSTLVGYSGWADREMAGPKLPVGTVHCSWCPTPNSTQTIVTSVNGCQLKRNVTVHSGTADPNIAVL